MDTGNGSLAHIGGWKGVWAQKDTGCQFMTRLLPGAHVCPGTLPAARVCPVTLPSVHFSSGTLPGADMILGTLSSAHMHPCTRTPFPVPMCGTGKVDRAKINTGKGAWASGTKPRYTWE